MRQEGGVSGLGQLGHVDGRKDVVEAGGGESERVALGSAHILPITFCL